jgi:hypothetical protein
LGLTDPFRPDAAPEKLNDADALQSGVALIVDLSTIVRNYKFNFIW